MTSNKVNPAHIIVPIGIDGAGKSYFADNFSKDFHTPIISQDAILEFISKDEYRESYSKIAYDIAIYHVDQFMKTNKTIVLDIDINCHIKRRSLINRAEKAGYKVIFVWLQIDQATARTRLERQSKTSVSAEHRYKNFDTSVNKFKPPNNKESHIVLSGKYTKASHFKTLLKYLSI